jgi:hypothetical protein
MKNISLNRTKTYFLKGELIMLKEIKTVAVLTFEAVLGYRIGVALVDLVAEVGEALVNKGIVEFESSAKKQMGYNRLHEMMEEIKKNKVKAYEIQHGYNNVSKDKVELGFH